VAHLVDYFGAEARIPASTSRRAGWGPTDRAGKPWTLAEIEQVRAAVEAEGLTLHAIENLDPGHWHDVLLDGPKREEQLEQVLDSIRLLGQAGVPCLGYNFSLAGVWGWTKMPVGRGGAKALVYDESKIDKQTPMPNGMVWNMVYDPDAPPGNVPRVESDELWQRYEYFVKEIMPVAEENGVTMALHPDDPPADMLRNTARLVNQPSKYQRVIDMSPSKANALEFCLGSLQEMREGNVLESIKHYGKQGKIAYVHFRNVRGKVPLYQEVFVDEGDLDMLGAIRALRDVGYDGVIIPDHTPEMSCNAPWHAGMAYALGYMKAALQMSEREST
jgi:mannonate dehydratase